MQNMTTHPTCTCGVILYPNETALCQDCVDRIEMEVHLDMMLAGETFYGQHKSHRWHGEVPLVPLGEQANNERCRCGRYFSDCDFPDCR